MSNEKLPVEEIFRKALALPINHFKELLIVGAPLIIAGTVVLIFTDLLLPRSFNFELVGLSVFLATFFILTLVIGIIGCHRIVILGPDASRTKNIFSWTGNEIRYIGWWLVIGICSALIAVPLMFIVMPLMSTSIDELFDDILTVYILELINIPIYYLVSRWSLVLPAAAVDIREKGLSWAWKLSEGNGWRLTLLVGFIPFMADLFFSYIPSTDFLLLNMMEGALWLLIGVVQIGLLSHSYRFLIDKTEGKKSITADYSIES